MVASSKPASSTQTRKSKTSENTPTSFAETQKLVASMAAKYQKAKRTNNEYASYVKRARDYLERTVAERKKGGGISDGIDTNLLVKAFDDIPNETSARALEAYVVEKCFVEGHKQATAWGTYSAFIALWDRAPGGLYAGDYRLDDQTGALRGNPARAYCVASVVKMVATRDHVEGSRARRGHANALKIEDLTKMMQWSEAQYSSEAMKNGPETEEELVLAAKHGVTRAFMSTGYTIWTRNYELVNLKRRDITDDIEGSQPPFFEVFLANRKGWEKKVDDQDGDLESNVYEIYRQGVKAMDMYTHLKRWIDYLETHILHRKLTEDEYIFPHFSRNGIPDTETPMSYKLAQKFIDEFVQGAGLPKRLTTHCLRRGGAQYRFLFAPPGQRWSLHVIRWWGGWAVDMLIKYLVDSLFSLEENFKGMLRPGSSTANQTLQGFDSDWSQAVSVQEFRAAHSAMLARFDQVSQSGQSCHDSPPDSASGSESHYGSVMMHELQSVEITTHSTSIIPRQGGMLLPIRKVPSIGRGRGAWRNAVSQWFDVNPIWKLSLKNWPEPWYTGNSFQRKQGAIRSNRKLIAEECTRLNGYDGFLSVYPNADTMTYTDLLQAIRRENHRIRAAPLQ